MSEIKKIEDSLTRCWSKETCYPPLKAKWRPENPSLGQCAITALIIQEFFGGDILYCKHTNHYWNQLPNEKEIDLTRFQFDDLNLICFDEKRTREQILNGKSALKAKTKQRYELLKNKIEKILKI